MQLSNLFSLYLANLAFVAVASPLTYTPSNLNPDTGFPVSVEAGATSTLLSQGRNLRADMVRGKGTNVYSSMKITDGKGTFTGKCISKKEWKGETNEFGEPKNRLLRTLDYQSPPPSWPKPDCEYLKFRNGKKVDYFAVYGVMYSLPSPAQDKDFKIQVTIKTTSQYLKNQEYTASMIKKGNEWDSLAITVPAVKNTPQNIITAKCVDGRLIKVANFNGTINRDLGFSLTKFPKDKCSVFRIENELFDVTVSLLGAAVLRFAPNEN